MSAELRKLAAAWLLAGIIRLWPNKDGDPSFVRAVYALGKAMEPRP